MYELREYQNELISKTRDEQRRGNKNVLLVSPAGSGKSVVISEIARLVAEKGGTVLFFVHRQELVNQIKRSFIANEVDMNKALVMTVGRVANRLDVLPKPSLIIADEAHHVLAKTYQDIIKFYSDVPRIGFTATPWRMNGKGFRGTYDAMVQGKSVQWLIDNGNLAPETIYAPASLIDPT
ncbi:MAG: DEAD/DEAH box helicase family protein, partial [Leuconostoc mesenteroides]